VHHSDIYFEKKLKDAFVDQADNAEGIIYDENGWDYFTAELMKKKLISSRDYNQLEKVKPSFPMTFDTFVQTVQ
jgi:hypothetical protein